MPKCDLRNSHAVTDAIALKVTNEVSDARPNHYAHGQNDVATDEGPECFTNESAKQIADEIANEKPYRLLIHRLARQKVDTDGH